MPPRAIRMPSSGPVGRTCASSTARWNARPAIYSPLIARMEAGQRQAPQWCAGCIKTCDPAQTPYCITHALIRAVEGDWEEGLFFCGAEVGQVNEMSTVAQVLAEYQAALAQR